jgi:hypothetical protein
LGHPVAALKGNVLGTKGVPEQDAEQNTGTERKKK